MDESAHEGFTSSDGLALAQLLADKLDLALTPVALAFVEREPAGVASLGKQPPSFCTLWRWAEERPIYVSAEQHTGCEIGGMVAGFVSEEGREERLAAKLEEMCEAGQGELEEIARTPRFPGGNAGVVYGPIWDMPVPPQLALMWATLPQMGVLQEVMGTILWRNNSRGAAFTRPACGVLAIAGERGMPAMSLGCLGMRVYTGIPPGHFLMAVPAGRLPQLASGLAARDDASERIEHYAERMRQGRPT